MGLQHLNASPKGLQLLISRGHSFINSESCSQFIRHNAMYLSFFSFTLLSLLTSSAACSQLCVPGPIPSPILAHGRVPLAIASITPHVRSNRHAHRRVLPRCFPCFWFLLPASGNLEDHSVFVPQLKHPDPGPSLDHVHLHVPELVLLSQLAVDHHTSVHQRRRNR